MNNGITIDQAIEQLQRARETAKLGGQTMLLICVEGEPYIPVTEIKVENDQDGAIALVMPNHEPEQITNVTVFQPDFDGEDDIRDKDGGIWLSSDVWNVEAECQALFPGRTIVRLALSDIEYPEVH